jgi:thymidylate synthase (FAD)
VHVELVKSSISDSDVVWAARVSTAGERSLESLDDDPQASRGLIRFLLRERHGTPFEHGSLTFLVKSPLFIGREILRHRVGFSYNEESGRYRTMSGEFYSPNAYRPLTQEGKPGAYNFVITDDGVQAAKWFLKRGSDLRVFEVAWQEYNYQLENGIPNEMARTVLPSALFSTMYVTCNARSLMSFLSLRTKSEDSTFKSYPQHEIQLVANKMEAEFERLMPITHAAFVEFGRVSP